MKLWAESATERTTLTSILSALRPVAIPWEEEAKRQVRVEMSATSDKSV